MSRIEEARQKAIEALQDAYGRTQQTPEGKMCRMGRIDRAYDLMAQANDKAKYKAAIERMEADTHSAFEHAERAKLNYVRQCKLVNHPSALSEPTCDCSYCMNEPTWRISYEDWERFITFFSTAADIDPQVRADPQFA